MRTREEIIEKTVVEVIKNIYKTIEEKKAIPRAVDEYISDGVSNLLWVLEKPKKLQKALVITILNNFLRNVFKEMFPEVYKENGIYLDNLEKEEMEALVDEVSDRLRLESAGINLIKAFQWWRKAVEYYNELEPEEVMGLELVW